MPAIDWSNFLKEGGLALACALLFYLLLIEKRDRREDSKGHADERNLWHASFDANLRNMTEIGQTIEHIQERQEASTAEIKQELMRIATGPRGR